MGSLPLDGKVVRWPFEMLNTRIEGDILAPRAVFREDVELANVEIGGRVNFAHARFEKDLWMESDIHGVAQFDGARIDGAFTAGRFRSPVSFVGVVFAGGASLDSLDANTASFDDSVFEQDAIFMSTQFGHVTFSRTRFKRRLLFCPHRLEAALFERAAFEDRVAFQRRLREATGRVVIADSRFDSAVSFGAWLINDLEIYRTSFGLGASFGGLHAQTVRVIDCDFAGPVDFQYASVRDLLDLSRSVFRAPVSFFHASLPRADTWIANATPQQGQWPRFSSDQIGLWDAVAKKRVGVFLEMSWFQQSAELRWEQVRLDAPEWYRVNSNLGGSHQDKDATLAAHFRTLDTLEEVFRRSSDLDGQNEVQYQRQLLERGSAGITAQQRLVNDLSRIAWGYGVRPFRLLAWMAALFLLFTGAVYSQAGLVGSDQLGFQRVLARVRFALAFSWRNAWSLTFGIGKTRTGSMRACAVAASLLLKTGAFFFLAALSNVFPLLKTVADKLLPW